MSKYLYLIKNIGVLTLSNLGSKILAFLLIPLYTSVLSTEQYGVFDLAQTTVSLCIPILSINISSAALRFALDKDKDKKDVFSVGILYILFAIIIFLSAFICNKYVGALNIFVDYTGIVILMFSSNILYGNLEILGDTPVGELVVVLDGEADKVLVAQKAIENAGVSLQVLKKGAQ